MPGRSEPPRNLGDMLGAQTRRNTPRRSSEFLKNIDAVLSEVDDSQAVREAKKAKNTAEIEKIFPGVEEDEKTVSGMYEPALHNFPFDEDVVRPRRPDFIGSISPSNELTLNQAQRMFPASKQHIQQGTGPQRMPHSHQDRLERMQLQFEESDLDPDTRTDFGTDRDERDYIGFQLEDPSPNPIGSDAYWRDIDTRSHNPQIRNNSLRRRFATTNQQANRAANEILGRNIRRRTNPVTNTRTAAQLMAQGHPARAGGRTGSQHNFVGVASPAYSLGRLPQDLNPRLRNVETDYTVFSYSTPIAWRTTQGHWEVPRVSYSRTTSRHQSALTRALSNTYHSTLAEASYRVSDLREQHLEQGIRLPLKSYELNPSFETFRPEPPSESMINAVVEDHVQQVINPAIERYRRRPSVQRRQNPANQSQLPFEGGIA